MIRDLFLFIALIFGVACAVLVIYMILDGMTAGINASPMEQEQKDFMTQYTTDFSNVWDYTFLTVYVAGILGLLILIYFLEGNPALLFGIILVVMILAAFAGYLANAWAEMSSDATISATVSHFPIMNYIISNYLTFTLVTGFLMIIVFFAKPGGAQ